MTIHQTGDGEAQKKTGKNRNGNMKGNTRSTRNVIPDDEMTALKRAVFEGIAKGQSRYELAKEHGVAWETVNKLFDVAMDEAGKIEDPANIIRRDLIRIERAYDKCTKDYHAGRCKATDYAAMCQLWHKYNGVDRYLDTVAPVQQHVVLEVVTHPVEVEMPADIMGITDEAEIQP